MKTHTLTGLIIAGALAASVAQAATSPLMVEEIYLGMSAAAIQKDQQANPAAEWHSTAGKSTCIWHHEAASNVVDQLHSPYPGSESNFGEKDHLAATNFNFVC